MIYWDYLTTGSYNSYNFFIYHFRLCSTIIYFLHLIVQNRLIQQLSLSARIFSSQATISAIFAKNPFSRLTISSFLTTLVISFATFQSTHSTISLPKNVNKEAKTQECVDKFRSNLLLLVLPLTSVSPHLKATITRPSPPSCCANHSRWCATKKPDRHPTTSCRHRLVDLLLATHVEGSCEEERREESE